MKIDLAGSEDAHGIAAVQVRSWQAAYVDILRQEFLESLSIERRTVQWQDILQKQESQTFVARRPEGVVGFVSLGRWRDEPASDRLGEIWALYVQPEVWGSGIGRALMDEAVRELRSQGRGDVRLWVLSRNLRGVRFYQRFGFREVPGSSRQFELGNREVEELCLRLSQDP